MTGTLNIQDWPSQNGNRSQPQDVLEAPVDAAEPAAPAAPPLPKVSTHEWSSLTQEMMDALPRVWSRGLLYLLVGLGAVVLPWTMLFRVDQTGQARGRLEPSSRVIQLDAPVAGTVATVRVKEGDTVEAGQVLLEFESELVRAELQQAQARLAGLRDRKNQLGLVQNTLSNSMGIQQLQAQAQISEQEAQLSQIHQRLTSSQTVYELQQRRAAIVQNQIPRYRRLWQAGAGSQIQLEQIESEYLEQQRLLEQSRSEIQQAQDELEKQQKAYERIVHTGELNGLEGKKQLEELQAQLLEVQAEIDQGENQIASLQFQLQQRVLLAPNDGRVFQMAVNHAGTVLQPGQRIAQIAPEDAPLILRAQMPSPESGFLEVGMPVKLKFDAYPFQDYGVVEGRVRWVSPDSKITETQQGNIQNYELEVVLDRPYVQAADKQVALTPGQTATAEVIIRQRRIIDILLDPFKKLRSGGLEL